MSEYTARQIIEMIANEYIELSHDKIKLQRDDHVRWAKDWLKANPNTNGMPEWLTHTSNHANEFYEDLKLICKGDIDIKEYALMLKWLDKAYEAGKNGS